MVVFQRMAPARYILEASFLVISLTSTNISVESTSKIEVLDKSWIKTLQKCLKVQSYRVTSKYGVCLQIVTCPFVRHEIEVCRGCESHPVNAPVSGESSQE